MSARLETTADEILIRPQYEGKPPGQIVCLLPGTGVEHLSMLTPDQSGAILIPREKTILRFTLG